MTRSGKSKTKRSRSKRTGRSRADSTSFEPVSTAAIAASLRSASVGDIQFDDSELDELTTAIATRHENVLRYRRDRKPTADASHLRPVPWYSSAGWLSTDDASSPRPSRTIDYAAGDYYLQDAGSLLALAAVDTDAIHGKIVLDLCAAPGGKAGGLLEALSQPLSEKHEGTISSSPPRGFLLANEPIGSRIAPLAYNLARTGADQYAITNLDPETLADRLPGVFDCVLVDAPCSGQAMMARGKQSATAVAESQIAINAARQRRILLAAERCLRPGGRLIYSTCTFAVAENEEQVRFMIDECGLSPAPVQALANRASPLIEAAYRLWPHRDGCAGSFAASMSRPEQVGDPEQNRRQDLWARMTAQSGPPDDAVDQLSFLFTSLQSRYQTRDWIIDAYPIDGPDWTSEDYVIGPEVAHRTGTTWKPSHAAALRRQTSDSVPRLAVDDETAMAYLSGQAIAATDRGWQIVEHQGRPLGWVKGDGRIGKNHLPTHARFG